MNWFVIQKNDVGRWYVYGPVKFVQFQSKVIAEMSDGLYYPFELCYKTKGGATKACYRRNYDEKGGR